MMQQPLSAAQMQLEDKLRVLESKVETEQLENQRLCDRLRLSEASKDALQNELTQKKAENAHLMSRLNETLAKIKFEDQKKDTMRDELQAQIVELEQRAAQSLAVRADMDQKIAGLERQLQERQNELNQHRNSNFEQHSKVGQLNTQMTMQKSELDMNRRRIQDMQQAESKMLTTQHTLKSERDTLTFQLAAQSVELNNQKAAARQQMQRFDQQLSSDRDQIALLERQLASAQAQLSQSQLELTREQSDSKTAKDQLVATQAQIRTFQEANSRLENDLKMSKMHIEKLGEEKLALQQDHTSLRQKVNKVMLMRPSNAAEDDAAERQRVAQRMIAEAQNRRKDTSLLGAQLQEMLVRNEQISSQLESRDSILLEKTSEIDLLKGRFEKLIIEKRQLLTSKNASEAQNKALSSVLSQRQLNEQQLYAYVRRLETAIREEMVFPQVQKRVNSLKDEEAKDQTILKSQGAQLEKISKLDDYARQVQERTLENKALEAELQEAQELVKTKEGEMQRIYKLLQEKQASNQSRDSASSNQPARQVEPIVQDRQLEFDKLLKTIDDKTNSIIELKSQLFIAQQELDRAKRQSQGSVGAQIRANDAQINAMNLNAENMALQMRNFQELQQKYLEEQKILAGLQSEKLAEAHKAADLQARLERAEAEKRVLADKSAQYEKTHKAETDLKEQLSQKLESLELQLSTSVTQARYLAMETQYKLKQGELLKLNEAVTAARHENFTLQASAANNQVKVNNLTEQLRVREGERHAMENLHEQEVRKLQQQLVQDRSQNNLRLEDQRKDDKVELQKLILAKEEEHAVQLEEREQLVAKLQEMIAEASESSIRMRTEMETSHKAELESLCQKHDQVVHEIKDQLLKTQEESARVANENMQYKKNVNVLLGKNETLQDVGEIQTEEIERLRGLPEEKKQFLSTQQLQSLNARVDQLKLQLDQSTSENAQLKAEREIVGQNHTEQINLLQSEISGLRNHLSDLKSQNETLGADVKRHQERALLSLVQPDHEKKAQIEKEVLEASLKMQERCANAERDLEHLRLQLQEKVKEMERLQRENAKLTFANEQQKAEVERISLENRNKDINLRGYNELAQVNHDLNTRNNDMVTRLNNLQSRLDLVDQKEKEAASLGEQMTKTVAERDAAKSENDKLRVIVRKKMQELKEVTAKFTAEMAELKKASQSAGQALVATGSGLSSDEKRELFEALELLKSENQALQGKLGETGGPKPAQQQQVFRSLMRALDRAKHITQVLDERRKAQQQTGQSGGGADGAQDEEQMPQVGQKRQRTE